MMCTHASKPALANMGYSHGQQLEKILAFTWENCLKNQNYVKLIFPSETALSYLQCYAEVLSLG